MSDVNNKLKFEAAFQVAKSEYEGEIKRFHEIDSKFNMLLVVFACVAAGIGFFVPNDDGYSNSVAVKVIVYILAAFMIVSLGLIIFGFFPRQHDRFNLEKFKDVKLYETGDVNFLSRLIGSYAEYVKCLRCVNARKITCLKAAYISVTISFLLFAIAILLVI